MILVVSYTIADKTRDLTPFYDAIKSAGTWWHHIENVWLIDTNVSPREWFEKLESYLSPQDNLVVMTLAQGYWGRIPKEAHEWLKGRSFSTH